MKEKFKNILDNKWNYLFLLPMLILFIMFTLYPIYNIVSYSFYEWDGFGPLTKFVGLRNYMEAVKDLYYWKALKNTLIFAASHLVFQAGLSLLIAVALNNTTAKLKNIYRLMIFLPVITTTSVIGMVMAMIFGPINGPINIVLSEIGLIKKPIMFLSSPDLSLWSTISVSIWKNIGVSLVYWLAALQTVPSDVYMAAKIDGANPVQTFWRITLPIIAPFGLVIALFAFKNGLYPFDIVKTMTDGGPAFSSDVIDTYLYRYAFNPEQSVVRYGFASAGGIFFALIVIGITLFLNGIKTRAQNKNK